MNPREFTPFLYGGKPYTLLTVHSDNYPRYSDFLHIQSGCDSAVITHDMKYLSVESLEEPGVYGFFILENNSGNVIAFAIIDLYCSNTGDKLFSAISVEQCAEITLICSNKLRRVHGLVSRLLNTVIYEFIRRMAPFCRYILLSTGTKDNNNLMRFYAKFGFRRYSTKSNLMILSIDEDENNKSNKSNLGKCSLSTIGKGRTTAKGKLSQKEHVVKHTVKKRKK